MAAFIIGSGSEIKRRETTLFSRTMLCLSSKFTLARPVHPWEHRQALNLAKDLGLKIVD